MIWISTYSRCMYSQSRLNMNAIPYSFPRSAYSTCRSVYHHPTDKKLCLYTRLPLSLTTNYYFTTPTLCGRCSFGGLGCCSCRVRVCVGVGGVVLSLSVCVWPVDLFTPTLLGDCEPQRHSRVALVLRFIPSHDFPLAVESTRGI